MPAISVVIPVYNAAPFLREAMDSLLAQTCGDFEAIAVNDGSTDNSLEILQEYAARDSRIRILDGPNGGYGKAMNRGMDAATGKYMAILEPDDYLPREAYAILLEKAEKHQLDVVKGTHCCFFEECGKRVFRYKLPECRTNVILTSACNAVEMLGYGPHIWTGLYRLDFLRGKKVRLHESPGASYQDAGFFFLCCVYAERYMCIDEPVYIYRTDNPNSSINTPGNKKYLIVREYEYVQRHLAQCGVKNEIIQTMWHFNKLDGILWLATRMQVEDLPGLADVLREEFPELEYEWMSDYQRARVKCLLEGCHYLPSVESSLNYRVCRRWLWGLCSKEMSALRTVFNIIGIPVCSRNLQQRWRWFNSGISAFADFYNEYRLLGVPISKCHLPMPVFQWVRTTDVYAICAL